MKNVPELILCYIEKFFRSAIYLENAFDFYPSGHRNLFMIISKLQWKVINVNFKNVFWIAHLESCFQKTSLNNSILSFEFLNVFISLILKNFSFVINFAVEHGKRCCDWWQKITLINFFYFLKSIFSRIIGISVFKFDENERIIYFKRVVFS